MLDKHRKPFQFKARGPALTFEKLVDAVKAGEDVLVQSRDVARELAEKVAGRRPLPKHLHHQPDAAARRQGDLPHYHPYEGGPHIFYKPEKTLFEKALDVGGDVIDLFSPFLLILPENFEFDAPPVAAPDQ
jgi:hypothetical protein